MSTVSESSVPKLEFEVFHSIYRNLYTTLAIKLMLDPVLSLQIMALWIWMEKCGFIATVRKIYELPMDLIGGLADEAIMCVNFFKNGLFPTPSELNNSIPLLQFLMKKELPLLFLPDNRASAVDGMKKVYNDICLKDLGDLYGEARRIHEAVKHRLSDNQIAQMTRSFNSRVSLGDANVGGNLSSGNPRLIGFGLGSSSLLQSGSSNSEQGSFNVGLSKSWNSGPGFLNTNHYNVANLGADPIKVVLPGSPISPHGYVGMGRPTSSSRGLGRLDAPISVPMPVRSKPNVGIIGQPRLARSASFNQELSSPRMTHGRSSGHMFLNPSMGVSPSTLIPPIYQQQFQIPDTLVSAEQRTLFVTFSKGYRVTEAELRDFITLCFGNCIESMFMQETHQLDEQPLYARIVFFCPETVEVVLNGCEKAKFTIHGKHVWARKFIPRSQRSNLHH